MLAGRVVKLIIAAVPFIKGWRCVKGAGKELQVSAVSGKMLPRRKSDV